MARYGRGLICVALTEERADHLRLFPMTQQNSSRFGTAFTETIEAREGVTTGISAADRAHTIRTASTQAPAYTIWPVRDMSFRCAPGGVEYWCGGADRGFGRSGPPGRPQSVGSDLRDHARRRRDGAHTGPDRLLQATRAADSHRGRADPLPATHERYIVRAGEKPHPDRYGEFRMIAYESEVNGGESHIALVRGDLCKDCPAFHSGLVSAAMPADAGEPSPCEHAVLVRVHTRCTAGDVFTADCRCRETLDHSMRMIAGEGCGVVLYLHNTSRGFEIDRTPADAFEPGGAAAPADEQKTSTGRLILHRELREREGSQARTGRNLRAIGLGGQILSDLGIHRIRLLSNTPCTFPPSKGFGLEIVEQVAIPVEECVSGA